MISNLEKRSRTLSQAVKERDKLGVIIVLSHIQTFVLLTKGLEHCIDQDLNLRVRVEVGFLRKPMFLSLIEP